MPSSQNLNQKLNKIVALQLLAIDQLYLHARLYKKWGLSALSEISSQKSSELVTQTEQLAKHIEQLDGNVYSEASDKMLTGTSAKLCLELDYKIATECQQSYLDAIKQCDPEQHLATIELLKQFIRQFESHSTWLNAELEFIRTRGIEAFIKNEMGMNQFWKLAAN